MVLGKPMYTPPGGHCAQMYRFTSLKHFRTMPKMAYDATISSIPDFSTYLGTYYPAFAMDLFAPHANNALHNTAVAFIQDPL
jgi:hypothetical protein